MSHWQSCCTFFREFEILGHFNNLNLVLLDNNLTLPNEFCLQVFSLATLLSLGHMRLFFSFELVCGVWALD